MSEKDSPAGDPVPEPVAATATVDQPVDQPQPFHFYYLRSRPLPSSDLEVVGGSEAPLAGPQFPEGPQGPETVVPSRLKEPSGGSIAQETESPSVQELEGGIPGHRSTSPVGSLSSDNIPILSPVSVTMELPDISHSPPELAPEMSDKMPEATAYTTTQAHPVFSSLSAAATLDRQSREPSPEREDLNFPTLHVVPTLPSGLSAILSSTEPPPVMVTDAQPSVVASYAVTLSQRTMSVSATIADKRAHTIPAPALAEHLSEMEPPSLDVLENVRPGSISLESLEGHAQLAPAPILPTIPAPENENYFQSISLNRPPSPAASSSSSSTLASAAKTGRRRHRDLLHHGTIAQHASHARHGSRTSRAPSHVSHASQALSQITRSTRSTALTGSQLSRHSRHSESAVTPAWMASVLTGQQQLAMQMQQKELEAQRLAHEKELTAQRLAADQAMERERLATTERQKKEELAAAERQKQLEIALEKEKLAAADRQKAIELALEKEKAALEKDKLAAKDRETQTEFLKQMQQALDKASTLAKEDRSQQYKLMSDWQASYAEERATQVASVAEQTTQATAAAAEERSKLTEIMASMQQKFTDATVKQQKLAMQEKETTERRLRSDLENLNKTQLQKQALEFELNSLKAQSQYTVPVTSILGTPTQTNIQTTVDSNLRSSISAIPLQTANTSDSEQSLGDRPILHGSSRLPPGAFSFMSTNISHAPNTAALYDIQISGQSQTETLPQHVSVPCTLNTQTYSTCTHCTQGTPSQPRVMYTVTRAVNTDRPYTAANTTMPSSFKIPSQPQAVPQSCTSSDNISLLGQTPDTNVVAGNTISVDANTSIGTLSSRVNQPEVVQQTIQLVSTNSTTTAVPNTNVTPTMAPPVPPAGSTVPVLQEITTQSVPLLLSQPLPVTSIVTSIESQPGATAAVTTKATDTAVVPNKQETVTTSQLVQPEAPAATVTNVSTQKISVGNNDGSTTSTIIVVQQPQTIKPYKGTTSWQMFKMHFERCAKANSWLTNAEKVQQLALHLDGAATEVLRDIDDESPTAYDDIWEALKRRFGDIDDKRDAQKKFQKRAQQEHETLAEYDQVLRTLYKQGWPDATAAQRDADLKARFEEGVTVTGLNAYLLLHTNNMSYPDTVKHARRFATTVEPSRTTKKVVRVSTPPHDSSINLVEEQQSHIWNKLDHLEQMIRNIQCVNTGSGNQGNRSRSQSPASGTGNTRGNGSGNRTGNNGDTQRFNQGLSPRPPSPRPSPEQSRNQSPRPPQFRSQQPQRAQGQPRWQDENRPPRPPPPRPQTPPAQNFNDRQDWSQSNRQWSSGPPQNNAWRQPPQQQQQRQWQQQTPQQGQRQFTGNAPNTPTAARCFVCNQPGCYAALHRRRPPGRCWVCNRRGCHSNNHAGGTWPTGPQRSQSLERPPALQTNRDLDQPAPAQNRADNTSTRQSPQRSQSTANSARDAEQGDRFPPLLRPNSN